MLGFESVIIDCYDVLMELKSQVCHYKFVIDSQIT